MGNWDITTPLDTDFISLGDDNLRRHWEAIQESLRCGTTEGTESIFPGSSPTTAPVFRYRGLKGVTGSRPAAGQYGFYFDSTRNVLQRDNGSSWDDVGTVIPATTAMVFYQASAPVGWTAVAANDKFLRVVTAGGTGGTTGGTVAASTGFSHTHQFDTTGSAENSNDYVYSSDIFILDNGLPTDYLASLKAGTSYGGSSIYHVSATTKANSAQVFAYADVIIAAKD